MYIAVLPREGSLQIYWQYVYCCITQRGFLANILAICILLYYPERVPCKYIGNMYIAVLPREGSLQIYWQYVYCCITQRWLLANILAICILLYYPEMAPCKYIG